MNKKFILIVLLASLKIMSVFAMNQDKQNRENQSAYYMALLAVELSTEQVNSFSGQFKQYKQEFLNLLQAFELYKNDSINLCNSALCKTGITKKRLTIEAFLTVVQEEHKEEIMRKLLHAAISGGDEASVEFILEQNVDLGDAQEEFTFLEVAYQNPNQGVASMLLEKTAGVTDTRKVNRRWSLRGTWQSIIK